MGRKKISTTVYLLPEQDETLKLLSGRTKVPVAEYIRQGIDMVLKANEKNIPHQTRMFDDRCHGCGFIHEVCICP